MSNLRFDRYAFEGKQNRPVSQQTRLTYEDYSKMSTHQRKQSAERRLTTPIWAVNDQALQMLLVSFMEERALIRRFAKVGTAKERLENAKLKIDAQKPRLESLLADMCRQYGGIKGQHFRYPREAEAKVPGEPLILDGTAQPFVRGEREKDLKVEIEAVDTYLRTTAKGGGVEVVAAIVYLYYRACLDSVGVGLELQIKPPHVRQILFRLHRCWRKFHASTFKPGVTAA